MILKPACQQLYQALPATDTSLQSKTSRVSGTLGGFHESYHHQDLPVIQNIRQFITERDRRQLEHRGTNKPRMKAVTESNENYNAAYRRKPSLNIQDQSLPHISAENIQPHVEKLAHRQTKLRMDKPKHVEQSLPMESELSSYLRRVRKSNKNRPLSKEMLPCIVGDGPPRGSLDKKTTGVRTLESLRRKQHPDSFSRQDTVVGVDNQRQRTYMKMERLKTMLGNKNVS